MKFDPMVPQGTMPLQSTPDSGTTKGAQEARTAIHRVEQDRSEAQALLH